MHRGTSLSGVIALALLVILAGTTLAGVYIPRFQYQLVSSDPGGGWNCGAYSMAMAIDKATGGAVQVTGHTIRHLTGERWNTGLSLPEIIVAANKLRVPVTDRSGERWNGLLAALRQGRGVILQGDYDVIPDYLSGQPSFDGRHAIYINHIGSTDRLYVMDPLRERGPLWMDQSLIRRFAEKLSRARGVYPSIYFAATGT
jgi:hypothetical protein